MCLAAVLAYRSYFQGVSILLFCYLDVDLIHLQGDYLLLVTMLGLYGSMIAITLKKFVVTRR